MIDYVKLKSLNYRFKAGDPYWLGIRSGDAFIAICSTDFDEKYSYVVLFSFATLYSDGDYIIKYVSGRSIRVKFFKVVNHEILI